MALLATLLIVVSGSRTRPGPPKPSLKLNFLSLEPPALVCPPCFLAAQYNLLCKDLFNQNARPEAPFSSFSMALQRILGLTLLCYGVIASPLGFASGTAPAFRAASPRKLHGRFLHITDLHPDSFYKPHSSTAEEDACHRGNGSAGTYGTEASDCDAPYALVNATFDWIAVNLRDQIDFIVWTGDSARHDSDEEIPRTQAQVLDSNRYVADKFANILGDATADRGLVIPVVPTFGNNDILPHNIMMPGPNKWLKYYTDVWRRFIPEEQRHSFEFGGWFYVEVIPGRLAVFSLNTLYFFDRNAGVDDCAKPSEPGYKQLEWLRIQLQFMRERGMKAILMGHVPPARTDSKQLWSEPCWQKYTLWLRQFRDVVVIGLYGHMNIDHFLLQDTRDIDMALLSDPTNDAFSTREVMEDELSIESATDYLHELRDNWSKLNRPPVFAGKPDDLGEDKSKKKKKKGKKAKKDVWGERYQLSFVSPSIVPTYFPSLRVFEYNISGLESTPLWKDAFKQPPVQADDAQKHLVLRDLSDSLVTESKSKQDKSKKKPKHKKPKDKKPKDPKLVIPDPPSKSSPPGPAYSAQTLSLTGYTQYFANLTFINNLTLEDQSISPKENDEFSLLESFTDWLLRWRRGKHGDKKPKNPEPQPRDFHFEVEYSTFEDKIYRLGDLTVNSFVDLAYRIGQKTKKSSVNAISDQVEDEDGDGDVDEFEVEDDDTDDSDAESDDDEDSEFEVDDKKKKKHGKGAKGGKDKKKKKKTKKHNKTWLHFLNHAFVGTVERRDLKKFARD
ncbi:Metallo-dependent phosphatase-like protein [Apodospora peruviana]|uniref:Endopolyphosphatase n=1 Tax=Apodospora peruviana TaxID=516989 RepID=A0AAE0ITS7_9PEZI|nr:Metallo-dependent phosphatase-like protein [Apodospora peruviana]